MCPLHTQSLSTVIGAGKPVAALFATPARCQSQYCAPVLDEFLDTITSYGDQIVPVHIEIYQKPTGTALISTVEAWRLPSEPWLFGIDATGTVQSRIDGAFGGTEMKALLDALGAAACNEGPRRRGATGRGDRRATPRRRASGFTATAWAPASRQRATRSGMRSTAPARDAHVPFEPERHRDRGPSAPGGLANRRAMPPRSPAGLHVGHREPAVGESPDPANGRGSVVEPSQIGMVRLGAAARSPRPRWRRSAPWWSNARLGPQAS